MRVPLIGNMESFSDNFTLNVGNLVLKGSIIFDNRVSELREFNRGHFFDLTTDFKDDKSDIEELKSFLKEDDGILYWDLAKNFEDLVYVYVEKDDELFEEIRLISETNPNHKTFGLTDERPMIGLSLNFKYYETYKYILETCDNTVIYIGVDSQKIKTRKARKNKRRIRKARYVTSIICHIKGNSGAKVFVGSSVHNMIDVNIKKPFNRLFKEAQMVAYTYLVLKDVIGSRKVELHIDINPKQSEGSYIAYHSSMGFIKGLTGITPITKPNAFASSYCADHFVKLPIY